MLASWRFAAPALNSYEDISTGQGPLTVSYCENADGRFTDILTLGPLVTDIDMSGADAAGGGSAGTAATVTAFAFTESMESTEYMLVARGTKLGIIKLSTRLNTADGTANAGAPYSEAVTDLLFTKAANATEEVGVFMDNSAFHVITTVADAAQTSTANNAGKIVRHAAIMGSDAAAAVVGFLGRSGSAGSAMNTVYQLVLSGTSTMDATALTTKATISGAPVIWTGIALDGRFWIIGTTDGPYYLDIDGARFRAMIEEIDNQTSSPTNCYGIRQSSFFGTLIPLERSTRLSNDLQGLTIGPEVYPRNTSPVRGRLGRGDGSELWDYWPFYNGTDTYICAVRPRQSYDLVADQNPVVYYPIIKLSSAESKAVKVAGRRGGQSRRTIYAGNGTDCIWWAEGDRQRMIDDSSYTYAASGTCYGTELLRNPHKLKTLKRVGFKTRNCTSTETISVDIVYRDHRETEQTVRVGAPVISNGWHWIDVPSVRGVLIRARSFYPKITLARGGTTTAAPQMVGDFIVEYEEDDR